ncbi:GtrA family protein [Pseudomonas sp. COW5]|uniref:GtrA family protein n=1 Tax=Pseudomonas sp. COW5 TaxID=2981253 RepID=UPI0022469114|nr:GtrA family protein [Pseudomonas sp. COW5]MCX2545066.1 GtrA family protein [Pseudomonas sp. COW5]
MTFAKYMGVQLLAYALDMSSFLLFAYLLDGQHVLANIFSKLFSGVFAFFLHRHFTFQSTETSRRTQAIRYFSLLTINIPVSSGLFYVTLALITPPAFAKFVSDAACTAITYWISKVAIFHKTPETDTKSIDTKGL